jgi:pseudouridine synthase
LTVAGKINDAQLRALQKGVLLDDGITAPAKVSFIKLAKTFSILEMTIHEGRNRQIRRMCETVGISLLGLQRVKFGPLEIGNVKEGKFRELSTKEVKELKKQNKELQLADSYKHV